MNFQDLKKIEKPDFYVKKALNKTKNIKRSKSKFKEKKFKEEELNKLRAIKDSLCVDLNQIIKNFPNLDNLDEFYRELIHMDIKIDLLKERLGRIMWCRDKIESIFRDYRNRISSSNNINKIKKFRGEFIGRSNSLMKSISKDLEFLENSRKIMRGYPNVKTKIPTIAIAGFPNVGKSTLLKKISKANVEIKNYAFTTKSLNLGYIDKKIQLIDTPGSLNRFDKMNKIEKQAYLVIKYLANKVIYVFDVSESCGFPIEDQMLLLNKLIKDFNKKFIIYCSKVDVVGKGKIEEFGKRFKNLEVFYEVDKLKKHITLTP